MPHAGPRFRLKRVYEPADPGDGTRILVDRLWPRGISRDDATVKIWLREIAPSTALRKWFHHDPSRWEEFSERYREELRNNAQGIRQMRELAREGPVTLVYAARDRAHNHAVVLSEYLQSGSEG